MTKRFSSLAYLYVFLLFCPSLADAVSVSATVDKTEATVEDTIVLTISVDGTRQAGEPQLPPELTTHFTVHSRGSSSRIQIINSKMNSGIDYTYLLYPKDPGTVTIGPAKVKAGGETFQSQPFTLHITNAHNDAANSRDLYITSEIDITQPYVNQQVVHTFRFYRSVKVANARLLEDLNFEGFYIESLGGEKEYTVVQNGKKYVVTEIKQALFPTQPGPSAIPPLRLQADVVYRSKQRSFFNDPFFDSSLLSRTQTKTRVLHAPRLTLTVRPLPESGKKTAFSNLVGDFSLSTSLEKNTLGVGDSTTLTITITGSGNIWAAVEPEFPSHTDAKIYSDKPVVTTSISDGRIRGESVFKKALVPLESGKLTVPPLTLCYFNPDQGRYEYCTTKPYDLVVTPASEKEDLKVLQASVPSPIKQRVTMVADEILPLHISLDALEHQTLEVLPSICYFLMAVPALVFSIGWGVKRRVTAISRNTGLLRSQKALSAFNKEIKKVHFHLGDASSAEFYRLYARIFKEYLGDKLGLVGSALTAQEAVEKLSSREINEKLIQRARDLLDDFEQAQFAFAAQRMQEREHVLKNMRNLAKQLEKALG